MENSKNVPGYAGKILRVDLTKGTAVTEPLPPEEILRRYIGGIGLGMYLILEDIGANVQPLDPEAPLLLMTGPLTGTTAPSSSNLAVVTLNVNTPFAVATAHTHGYWAAYLKHAGYDAIYITGQASKPVYLWVDDDRVEIKDAANVWGQTTRETERLIKLELNDEEKISVAAIGPAGEAQLHGASIRNDRNHGANKGSIGAVMGSKNLKAVAVRGTGRVPLAEPEQFHSLTQTWQDYVLAEKGPGEGAPPVGALLRDGGVTKSYEGLAEHGLLASKNLTDPEWGKTFTSNIVSGIEKYTIIPKESYNCSITCAYDCKINSGEFAGFVASMCGGGENIEGASAMIGVDKPDHAYILTDYMDSMGIDSSVAGALMGMAYELYDRGIITQEDTGGLDLSWGNFESAIELLDQMCSGEGFGGTVLAKGLKEASTILGPPAEACVVHIRGGGINMHDWRGAWSVLLGQIVAGAGVCWQGPGFDTFTTEPDLGYTEFTEPFEVKGKADNVAKSQIKKLWEDTLGICWFACWGVKGVLDYSSKSIGLATGWSDFNTDEALRVGERMVNMQRLIAVKRGFKPEDEFDISKRLLEAPTSGVAKGKSIEPHLKSMVLEYYSIMGWDEATARPTSETLERNELTQYQ